MKNLDEMREIMRNKQLASLGDAYVNFIYSLALTRLGGNPRGIKVSDKILADALKQAGLRDHLGTRITKKELANASESLLVEAYLRDVLTIQESIRILAQHPEGLLAGLSELLKTAATRVCQR